MRLRRRGECILCEVPRAADGTRCATFYAPIRMSRGFLRAGRCRVYAQQITTDPETSSLHQAP